MRLKYAGNEWTRSEIRIITISNQMDPHDTGACRRGV
jgi:hypothetical protein